MTQLRSLAFSVNGGLEASSVARRSALASLETDGGWWLVLFDRIADRWGITRRASGTCVWFELRSEP